MITAGEGKKLIVISDVHIGNPFSKGRHELVSFLRWAALEGFDICINGDGLEIAQTSFNKLVIEMPEIIRTLKEIKKMERSVYYIVGNHDIALENFLEDWGGVKVCPFLNYTSGETRIRIEHGHLYDSFFINFPNLYESLTRFAGLLLAIHPSFYKLWMGLEKMATYFQKKGKGILGEGPEFSKAALEITRRGFDAVIFGHTHHLGEMNLSQGKKYFNSGSWLISYDYIEIHNGKIEIKNWSV
ncbi:MAG: UDP-2,3-diacylglucosamine diphosphatase [Alphaproteobacteria bacterium]|nr:MAG: UDP-2,3-diacylglucosamine diphosphatase [Alphaproteobacteria bacterium]